MRRCANIPVFIPHRGCPNRCVFCDQRVIARDAPAEGDAALLTAAEETIDAALATLPAGRRVEIAYFGGSFTGIAPQLMEALLALAQRYVDWGRVEAIRCSTRPDYVCGETLERLARYALRTIELGVQSLDDGVLAATRRGHTASQALDAIARLHARGYAVVGQMMLGLPASSAEAEFDTARRLCAAGVEAVRIYPTLVLRDTALAADFLAGRYLPLSLAEAVARTATLLEIFDTAGIEVLRVGLQETDLLRQAGNVLAGPHHSAFGELALSECFWRRIDAALEESPTAGDSLTIAVPRGRTSAAIGHRRCNVERIDAKFGRKKIKVIEMDTLFGYNIRIES